MNKIIWVIVVLNAAIHSAESQQCGTVVTQENLDFLAQLRSRTSAGDTPLSSSATVTIPVKFHAIRTSTGSGGISPAQRDDLIQRLNDFYVNSNMLFEHVGEVNEIISDDHYDFKAENEGAVAVANDVSKTVNVYFFNSVSSNGLPLCGYAYFPPSADRIIMNYNCISNGTLEHEFGHYFSLFHTHGTTNTGTTDELVDGSNCTGAGDRICDTPADPNLSGNVNASCSYTGIAKDANGDTYRPDPSNIMSYAPGECRNRFTTGQYDRVRTAFENSRSYLNFTTEEFSALILSSSRAQCIGGSVEFEAVAFGAESYEWTFEGGSPATSTLVDPIVTYDAGGSFDVELRVVSNNGDELEVIKRNFVKVEDPLQNTLQSAFTSSIDSNVPLELNIDNPDEGFTFQYNSSVDRNNEASSGSIWVNNYGYFTENSLNIDRLFLKNYDTKGIKKFDITFDYAYAYRPKDGSGTITKPAVHDSLTFQLRSQCGSASQVFWHEGGDDLKTAPPTLAAFVPNDNQWITKSFVLDVVDGLEFAGFEFVSHSYNGNNLYIDNIQIIPDYSVDAPSSFRLGKVEAGVPTLRWFDQSTNETAFILERAVNEGDFVELVSLAPNTLFYRDSTLQSGNSYRYRLYAAGVNGNVSELSEVVTVGADLITNVEEELELATVIYPNPAIGQVVVRFEPSRMIANPTFSITDISGKIVLLKMTLKGGINTINVENLNPGIYLAIINQDSNSITKRLIKK